MKYKKNLFLCGADPCAGQSVFAIMSFCTISNEKHPLHTCMHMYLSVSVYLSLDLNRDADETTFFYNWIVIGIVITD